ncbi:predicted protein [Histoplasma capsulatum var. duboisii H88]|uniref:Predicted protein n=2 Tax=Ajellomyces capsulatus TaxID=5037 RepID=F0ULJ9_AJEC8|nr:predicted protein [Histoplasma capsulatum H143]EGC47153.1 predicted protein [Histoplasma capsulatum var. duboisii H88]
MAGLSFPAENMNCVQLDWTRKDKTCRQPKRAHPDTPEALQVLLITGNKCLDSQGKCSENPTAVWIPADGCCLVEPTKADRGEISWEFHSKGPELGSRLKTAARQHGCMAIYQCSVHVDNSVINSREDTHTRKTVIIFGQWILLFKTDAVSELFYRPQIPEA